MPVPKTAGLMVNRRVAMPQMALHQQRLRGKTPGLPVVPVFGKQCPEASFLKARPCPPSFSSSSA